MERPGGITIRYTGVGTIPPVALDSTTWRFRLG
ncbi:hypothetical protein SAMN05421810_11057 [Amycolatopsis arida]|uniref:Uncharacterized protein n=1 Tax=Amycolatopsis arida TaxID=587909 RepID=A0A1I5ZQP5_9PSEU|nr:hypothetical protein CLV69_11057 [Amycolatopsis arida]SFQ58762.1 hypothetical protein SAMN05421810_11057 [Amycolatopsis arida]